MKDYVVSLTPCSNATSSWALLITPRSDMTSTSFKLRTGGSYSDGCDWQIKGY
jgi:hypothetical protein